MARWAWVAQALPAVETLVSFLVEQLLAERPDAVAFDSNAIWGRMAASPLDLPKISLVTTMTLGAADYQRLTAREWIASLLPMLPNLPRVVAARWRVLRRFGKRLYPPAPTLPMRGDVTIFPIPHEIQPPHPLIDERCHFVGPMIDQASWNETLDVELATHLNGPEPVVLASLGTLHAGTDAFFRGCFEVLADLPVRGVLAVGSYTDPNRLGRPPANTLVRPSVPQLSLLARAAVFITHGGMNSVLEGLAKPGAPDRGATTGGAVGHRQRRGRSRRRCRSDPGSALDKRRPAMPFPAISDAITGMTRSRVLPWPGSSDPGMGWCCG